MYHIVDLPKSFGDSWIEIYSPWHLSKEVLIFAGHTYTDIYIYICMALTKLFDIYTAYSIVFFVSFSALGPSTSPHLLVGTKVIVFMNLAGRPKRMWPVKPPMGGRFFFGLWGNDPRNASKEKGPQKFGVFRNCSVRRFWPRMMVVNMLSPFNSHFRNRPSSIYKLLFFFYSADLALVMGARSTRSTHSAWRTSINSSSPQLWERQEDLRGPGRRPLEFVSLGDSCHRWKCLKPFKAGLGSPVVSFGIGTV